jgi:hypothetical protein
MAKVVFLPDGCWLFTGFLTTKGYGHIRDGRKMRAAHVVIWEAKNGPVPNGKELDHVQCQRKACCNPDHVEPVTHIENIRRAVAQSSAWGFARLSEDERRAQAQRAAAVRWGL